MESTGNIGAAITREDTKEKAEVVVRTSSSRMVPTANNLQTYAVTIVPRKIIDLSKLKLQVQVKTQECNCNRLNFKF